MEPRTAKNESHQNLVSGLRFARFEGAYSVNRGEDRLNTSILLAFDEDEDHFGNQIPVRFRVGNTELLMSHSETGSLQPGLPLLVAPFATLGMASLRLAKETGRAALDLDDYAQELLFKMNGREIIICSTMLQVTVPVSYEDLFAGWLRFARRVKEVVVEKHPDRASYAWWTLIDEYPDAMVAEQLTRSYWFDERPECFS
jgi:hypothetical protein